MLKKVFIVFLFLFGLFFALKTNAQVQNGDIALEITPKYPKANEEVRASLSTYTTDLNSARITWLLDGEVRLEGVGKKSFSFQVGSLSFQTVLEAKIQTITGAFLTKKVTIAPANIDMLWQAYDTYAPPFYKGKTLASVEGMVKVVAFPNVQNIAGFNYLWKLDNKNKPASSGYQKNYFIYRNSYLEDRNTVNVTVSDIFGNANGEGSITIRPGNPKIFFYKKDIALGTLWEKSLDNSFAINPEGETLIAEPYFFHPKNFDLGNVSFRWLINGQEVIPPKFKNQLAVKQVSGQSGSATIKTIINNANTLFESAEKDLNVSF